MKEQKLIEMRNKIENLGAAVMRLVQELEFLKDLAVGNHELMKKFEGYDAAVEALKESLTPKEESEGLDNFDNSQ